MDQKSNPEQPQGNVPELEAIQPSNGQTVLAGVTKMIVPSIMQCSQGGYITVIPGVGAYASSSLQEAVAFVEKQADMHFTKRGQFPKIIADAASKAKEVVSGGVRRVDGVILAVVLAGVLIGWTLITRYNNDRRETERVDNSPGYPYRPSILNYRRSSEEPRIERPQVLPEVYVREVQTETIDGRAERALQNGSLRPLPARD